MQSIRFFPKFFVPFCAVLLAGCNRQGSQPAAETERPAAKKSQLSVISPHGHETQVEFERLFKAKHPEVDIKWLDFGGSTDDLRFVQSQFKGKGPREGINVDLFFGGGGETFLDLEKAGYLQPLPSDFGVPAQLNGVPLRGQNNTWVAAALSGFGILYNKDIAGREQLPIPATWADLGNPKLLGRIELADPRHSGSAHTAYEIILQTNGWQRGWQILTAIAGNTRGFIASSSQLLKDVESGEVIAAPAIDFYARSSLALAEEGKLGYAEPPGQRVVTADPIAILRGAPNLQLARDFVQIVMSPAGQKLWLLKKGAPGGPQENELYRLAALPAMYKPLPQGSLVSSDPYAARNKLPYDSIKAAIRRRVLDDLIGAVLIDNHKFIKARWAATPNAQQIAFVPVEEAELTKLAEKWSDAAFSKNTTTQWSQAARQHFGG